jgi:hypothetical protein
LAKETPPDEVRLLEVNGTLAGSRASVEAVDSGLNVAARSFRLLVANITTDQLFRAMR